MKNTLWTGDNLYVLHGMNSETVDLIYLDPPFNTNRIFAAPLKNKESKVVFEDMWTWQKVDKYHLEELAGDYPSIFAFIQSVMGIHGKSMAAYLIYIAQRLVEMKRVLKSTGSIYLHCDPTASHYLKLLMDEIFGKSNFRNEIVWCYRGAGYPKKDFGKRHDIIFKYSKEDSYIFNLDDVRDEYAETTKERFKHFIGNKRYGKDFGVQKLNPKGRHPDDWWQIQPIAPSAKERTGYPTQKPLKLLYRIIKASSNEEDIVLDPFCGCATTCVAAQQLGRKWVGIDVAKESADLVADRLADDAGLFKDFVHRYDLPKRTDVEKIEETKTVKERLFKDQNGTCNGCKRKMEIYDFEIDHIVPRAKEGGDYYENYQLLCPKCNRDKGTKTMAYLLMKVETRKKLLIEEISF